MHGDSILTQKLVQVFYLVITYNIHTVNDTKHTIYYDTSLAVTADAHAEAILILLSVLILYTVVCLFVC